MSTDPIKPEQHAELQRALDKQWQILCNRMAVANMAFTRPGALEFLPDLFGPVWESVNTLQTALQMGAGHYILPVVQPQGEFVEAAAEQISTDIGFTIPDDISSLDQPDQEE
jgi:hypothetical protein